MRTTAGGRALKAPHRPPLVSVVVLGDLGRSPRMQNHALACADHGAEVTLFGEAGSALHPELEGRSDLRVVRFGSRASERAEGAGVGWRAARHAVRRAWRLAKHLLSRGVPDVILVQTPPSWPTLPVAWACARLRGARLVIDWHSYGHAMLGLALGPRHVAVRALRGLERFFAGRADAHLCVSDAMARDLEAAFGVRAVRVHDRPTRGFRAHRDACLDPELASQHRERLAEALGLDLETVRGERALLVSPTSWTRDEDLELLAASIERLAAASRASGMRFAVVVTGRGPRRDASAPRLAALDGDAVRVRTAWLAPDDYRALLAVADLGLSFFRSASGLDLPMKIVDMLGAGLPVCALDYAPVLCELVEADRHGWLFASADGFAQRLLAVCAGFPDAPELAAVRSRLRNGAEPGPDWDAEWSARAAPTLFPNAEKARTARTSTPP